jgi:hypothetical protein
MADLMTYCRARWEGDCADFAAIRHLCKFKIGHEGAHVCYCGAEQRTRPEVRLDG